MAKYILNQYSIGEINYQIIGLSSYSKGDLDAIENIIRLVKY